MSLNTLEKLRKKHGFNKTQIADALGIVVSTLTGYWYKQAFLSEEHSETLRKFFKEIEEKEEETSDIKHVIRLQHQALETESSSAPTLAEISRVKQKLELKKKEPNPEFEIPSIKALQQANAVRMEEIDKVRASMSVSMTFMDHVLGWSKNKWSYHVRKKNTFRGQDARRVLNALVTLRLLAEGVKMEPVNGDKVDLTEEVKVLEIVQDLINVESEVQKVTTTSALILLRNVIAALKEKQS